MNLTNTLSTDIIESIDFDLEIDSNRFAQTTILKSISRCKVFYCFKNDDTREDGEDRCTHDSFSEICSALISILSDNDLNRDNKASLKYNLEITTTEKDKHIFNNQGLTPQQIKAIINLLACHIDEFTFLPAFNHYI